MIQNLYLVLATLAVTYADASAAGEELVHIRTATSAPPGLKDHPGGGSLLAHTVSDHDAGGTKDLHSRSWLKSVPDVEALVESKPNFTMIQVGSCDGDSACSAFDVERSISTMSSDVRMVIMEPSPPIYSKLLEDIAAMPVPGEAGHIFAINQAVCTDANSGHVTLHVVSPQLAIDFPKAPHWGEEQLSSMSLDDVLDHAVEVEGLTRDEMAHYVDAMQIPCETPTDLFQTVDFAPQDLDVLVVDTQGSDALIVSQFLQVMECVPTIIVFESKRNSEGNMTSLLTELNKLGYIVNCPSAAACVKNHNKNIVATNKAKFMNITGNLPRLEPTSVASDDRTMNLQSLEKLESDLRRSGVVVPSVQDGVNGLEHDLEQTRGSDAQKAGEARLAKAQKYIHGVEQMAEAVHELDHSMRLADSKAASRRRPHKSE